MDISLDKAIAGLDLEAVKHKLMHSKTGAEWPRERVDAAEEEYRRFMLLMKMFPEELAAPSLDVDRFWHHHIIETAKYARDCETVFGYFLHRYPNFGMGEQDASPRLRAGARMRELYREVFGVQDDKSGAEPDSTTSFAVAVRSRSQIETPEPHRGWPPSGAAEQPDELEDLLGQLRIVVIENQRYDRVAEPVV
jgi:hypothetical protein